MALLPLGLATQDNTMTMRQFIKDNRQELTHAINGALSNEPDAPMNDTEREQWINNDEGLYVWARSEGVRI